MSYHTKAVVLCQTKNITKFMPPYHTRLHNLWWKIKLDGENYKPKELERYREIHEKIRLKEDWNQQKREAIAIQNNHQYFKDNPIRKCPKCRKNVLAESNKCDYKRIEQNYSGRDSTENAYYVGDHAAAEHQSLFHDMFTLCLPKYPRGDTIKYDNGLIGPNSDRE